MQHRGLNSVLRDSLEGRMWQGWGRFGRKGPYVHVWLTHAAVWQKPTQSCNTVVLQFKKKNVNFKDSVKGSNILIASR